MHGKTTILHMRSGIALCLMLLLFPVNSLSGQLTPQERRGKELYLRTTSPSGNEIKAFVGKSLMEAPGEALPCVNCHGYDGVGLVESGVTATTITWEELTKAYGLKHSTGREHPPYTEETIIRAIVDGVDPAGNVLDVAMPRYKMSNVDLDDLISYLKRIGTALDPGLSPSGIKVGTVLPLHGSLGQIGQAMQAILRAYFNEVNSGGGIYGRKVELEVREYSEDTGSTFAVAKQMIDSEEIFALVSPFTAEIDAEIISLAETQEMPLIGPFTLFPADVSALNRFTFYLFSGLREQLEALMAFSKEILHNADAHVAIVYAETGALAEIAASIQGRGSRQGWKSLQKVGYQRGEFDPSRLVKRLSKERIQAVFFLGGWRELDALMREGGRADWNPYIFLSGSAVQEDVFDVPKSFNDKIFLAYPSLPSDHTPSGLRELSGLLDKYKLSRQHLAAQVSAYCAAKILVEGLKRSGRSLSRERLVAVLEKLYDYDTGLTPRITYDPNRRIGALGAHIVAIDLEKRTFVPLGKWITLE